MLRSTTRSPQPTLLPEKAQDVQCFFFGWIRQTSIRKSRAPRRSPEYNLVRLSITEEATNMFAEFSTFDILVERKEHEINNVLRVLTSLNTT